MSGTRKLPRSVGVKPRYAVRLRLVPLLSRIGAVFGMSWGSLGQRFGRESLIGQLQALGCADEVGAHPQPLDVVFLTMMGGNHRLAGVEVVLGRALALRGHRVRYVLCDQQLPACEVKWQDQEHRWAEACGKCYAFGRALLASTGLDVIPVSELLHGGPAAQREWPEYVESALLKHFHVGVLEENEQVAAQRTRLREAASVSERVGHAVAALRPDRVVMSHGIYCTWGPAREVLLEAGIPILTYGEGKKKDTMKFNWNTSADWWDVSDEWERVRDVPLTQAQERQIDDYLASRRRHDRDARVYNFGEEEPAEALRSRLGLDPTKPTCVLFTNVLWDAASAQREIAFSNPVEWVTETISWFARHPEKQLVVKVHPAEVVIGTRQPFASILAREFPTLPENVRLIPPDAEVNSWSVIELADLGLVHTSTIGMELPLEGVPCVVVSRTHFR